MEPRVIDQLRPAILSVVIPMARIHPLLHGNLIGPDLVILARVTPLPGKQGRSNLQSSMVASKLLSKIAVGDSPCIQSQNKSLVEPTSYAFRLLTPFPEPIRTVAN